jgi:hypothetical protein
MDNTGKRLNFATVKKIIITKKNRKMMTNQTRSMVAAFLNLFTDAMASKDYQHLVFAEELPMKVKSFVQMNFPAQAISYAELKTDPMESEYHVWLNNGVEICFGIGGDWNYIDFHEERIPPFILPEEAMVSARRLYADARIVRVSKHAGGCYSMVLSNGISFRFSE